MHPLLADVPWSKAREHKEGCISSILLEPQYPNGLTEQWFLKQDKAVPGQIGCHAGPNSPKIKRLNRHNDVGSLSAA